MISRLSGSVWAVGEDHLVVGAAGIGFRVYVPAAVPSQVGGVGQNVELHTYLHVRENELSLYGFLTEEELLFFKLLLSVSGIGPKLALAVLGVVSPKALRQAVFQEELGILTRVPGVGQKTARAVIFHLKDKLAASDEETVISFGNVDTEVLAALTGLGFSIVEAQRALQGTARDTEMPVEERVRQALILLDRR